MIISPRRQSLGTAAKPRSKTATIRAGILHRAPLLLASALGFYTAQVVSQVPDVDSPDCIGNVASVFEDTITVTNVAELEAAIAQANGQGGNLTIRLADGTYPLNDTIYINVPNVRLEGESGDRTRVTIEGDAMGPNAEIGNLIRITGSGVSVRDLTLQKSRWHLIQVAGEADADDFVASNLIFRDAYEQMLKVTYDPGDTSVHADNGLVEYCLFEYSAGIGPQYYIGGIDAHAAHDWVVRNNTFRDIASPNATVAEHAIHFWSGASGTLVEGNTIIDCDRGIGFGLTQDRGHFGGVIRNNAIYHSDNGDPFADTGIALVAAPDAVVYHNTVHLESGFPWTIEYRFPQTTGVTIRNNLTNGPIRNRDGASATVSHNVTDAAASWYIGADQGDLHLATDSLDVQTHVIDLGMPLADVTDDIDGDRRPHGDGYDIGADELTSETECPLTLTLQGRPKGLQGLDNLRRVRDEVLGYSPEGEKYVQLYYDHGPEVSQLMLQYSELRIMAGVLSERLLPIVPGVLAGEPTAIESRDVALITLFLRRLEANGSADLSKALSEMRTELRDGDLLERFGVEVR